MKPELLLTLPSRPVPYAVLGQPIHHSLSPAMQQAAFDHCGIEARYFRIEVGEERLTRAVRDLRDLPFGGWNCTVPNKIRMAGLCDGLAESARRLRAVNVVVNEAGKLIGHNTDGLGWSRALREAFGEGPESLRILLLGAGGAGRAIATQAMLEKCPRLTLANRNPARARDLAEHLRSEFTAAPLPAIRVVDWKETEKILHEVDLVVNATAAGLDPKEPAVLQAAVIPSGLRVFDALYGNSAEKLRLEVEAAGGRWSDGLGMLLHQGGEAFSLWTRRDAPLEVMRRALADAFSASRR